MVGLGIVKVPSPKGFCRILIQYRTNRWPSKSARGFIRAVNKLNNKYSGAPSGVRSVVTTGADNTSQNNLHETTSVGDHKCDTCERQFTTNRGLQMHIRRMHATLFHSRGNKHVPSHRRWTDDERRILAISELAARGRTDIRNMNVHLAKSQLGRTIESIKGQRKQLAYKTILDQETVKQVISVREYEEEVEPTSEPVSTPTPGGVLASEQALRLELDVVLRTLVRKRRNLKRTRLNHEFVLVAREFLESGCANIEGVMDWLNRNLARNVKGAGPQKRGPAKACFGRGNHTARKRREYAYQQFLYGRNKRRLMEHLVNPIQECENSPNAISMFDYWQSIYQNERVGVKNNGSNENEPILRDTTEKAARIWSPITAEEVRGSRLHIRTAAGPDGVSVRSWNYLQPNLQRAFYMIIMLSKDRPSSLYEARTTFIPKGENADAPGMFRPISITSVIMRQFHRILAKRLLVFRQYNEQQRGFRWCDGVAENLTLLQATIKDAARTKNELHMVSIDLMKAYDSVTHEHINGTIKKSGCPEEVCAYFENMYKNSSTHLQFNGDSRKVKVLSGVYQGDPTSPVLFNWIMDGPIGALNREVGYCLKDSNVTCIAFADDVVLMAKSKEGMMYNIDRFVQALKETGLTVNTDKSFALSIVPNKKSKQWLMVTSPLFTIDSKLLRQIGPDDKWKYLGVTFVGQKTSKEIALCDDLEKLNRAALKPRQKMNLIKFHLIPKYQHQMVLTCITNVSLNTMDKAIRRHIREWLHLPQSVPNAYIYAGLSSGGLSVPCLSIDIPRIRLARLNRFIERDDRGLFKAIAETAYYTQIVEKTTAQLQLVRNVVEGDEEVTKECVSRYWVKLLDECNDTRDLSGTTHCREVNAFVYNDNITMTGQDYVHFHQIRTGCIPTKARCGRGRDTNVICRGCGLSDETNYHVLQACERSKGMRTKRHDVLLNVLQAELGSIREGETIHREPLLNTRLGIRKPDLVIVRGRIALILEVHIVSGLGMENARAVKINKYKDIEDYIKEVFNVEEVIFETLTMSYKGVFERNSARALCGLGVTQGAMRMMSASVLRGAWLIWWSFRQV